MVSWEPVKRLRERFVVGLGVLKRRSSEEEPRLEDDSERKRLALIEAMKRRVPRSHNGFITGCLDATRRACKPTLSHVIESGYRRPPFGTVDVRVREAASLLPWLTCSRCCHATSGFL